VIVRNFVANLIGQFVYPILSFLLVPFYIRYLGLEGYGLVGFFSMLVALLGAFSKGLGAALQREFARFDQIQSDYLSHRRLLYTFERIYFALSLFLSIGLISISTLISGHWLKTESIPSSVLNICLIIISVRISISLPASVYQSAFMGTQKQVLGNLLNGIMSVMGAILGVIAIVGWSSIVFFYLAEVITAVITLFLKRYWAYRIFPMSQGSKEASFSYFELKRLWKISLGLIWTNGIGLIITQMDRLYISKALQVASLGIYNAGIAGGRLLNMIAAPFLNAVYPRTCQISLQGNQSDLEKHIRVNNRIVFILCVLVGVPFCFFASEVIWIWTGNEMLVANGKKIMEISVWSYLFLSLASVLYQIQIGMGKTQFGVVFNAIALIGYPVLLSQLIHSQGLNGAAWSWFWYCLASLIFHVLITAVFISKVKTVFLFLKDIVLGISCTIVVGIGIHWLANNLFSRSVWGRVCMAIIASVINGFFCYVLYFGLHIPREFSNLLRSIRNRVGLKAIPSEPIPSQQEEWR